MNDTRENLGYIVTIAIYAFLTHLWFDANEKNILIFIGHTDLVNGWVLSYASKTKLFIDLIYFALSVAAIIVTTQIIINQIKTPLLKFKEDEVLGVAAVVNLIVLVYEFHILEFRIKLIGLAIALIIFFAIGVCLAMKILEILKPIFKVIGIADTVNDYNGPRNLDRKITKNKLG